MKMFDILKNRERYRNNRADLFLFHSVKKEIRYEGLPFGPKNEISAERFEKIIQLIAKKHTPISMEDLLGGIKSKSLPKNPVIITFDDGFKDNLTTALPILEKYGTPATVYITTGFVERDIRPFEYDLACLVAQVEKLSFTRYNQRQTIVADTKENKRDCYEYLRKYLKYLEPKKRNKLLSELEIHKIEHISNPNEMYLNWEEARGLSSSRLISIGSHSHSHSVLTRLSAKEVLYDVKKSKELLKRNLNMQHIDHFSYPYGEYCQNISCIIQSMGFHSSVATKDTHFDIDKDSIYEIPRIESWGKNLGV
jgi:peptidoglycan/xylan/chitin deacetylase (PgdA/CDA1 family)